ncbi:uridine kinase [Plantactinospora sp. GCM10030261]|uniref:uridine kinase family protein n=1 Tax=Plantactinospora sp. GCM10030261 TaxID=3273420 RepID=UPI00360D15FD
MPVEETYQELGRRVLATPARLGPVRLVAIDGPSGAGKTLFAGRLTVALAGLPGSGESIDAPVVHTDDLLDGWADQFTFWSRLEDWVLGPLRAGRPGRYRRYSWIRREFTPRWVPVPAAPVVILEGVSAARATIRPELSLAVFVTAPRELRLDRALARDGPAVRSALERWRLAEDTHFTADDTERRSDLVVDGAPGRIDDPDNRYLRVR